MEDKLVINFLNELGLVATPELILELRVICIEELLNAHERFVQRVQQKVQEIHTGKAGQAERNGGDKEAFEIPVSVQGGRQ
jgi:hypothetical protein